MGKSSILLHFFAVLEYDKSIHQTGEQGEEHKGAFSGGICVEGGILPVVSLFVYTEATTIRLFAHGVQKSALPFFYLFSCGGEKVSLLALCLLISSLSLHNTRHGAQHITVCTVFFLAFFPL